MKKILKLMLLFTGVFLMFTACASHTHSPVTTKMYSDENGHYYKCSCGEQMNYEAHAFDEGEVLVEANEYDDGIIDYTCTICGYVYTKIIDHTLFQHVHDYKTLNHDGTSHWYECSCGEKENITAHTYNETIITKATLDKTGSKRLECSVCNYSKVVDYTLPQDEQNEIANTLKTNINNLDQAGVLSELDKVNSYLDTYNKLNSTAQELVTNYSNLTAIKDSITLQINNATKTVNGLISEIGDIITLSEANKAIEAYELYEQIDKQYQEFVEGADVLKAAYKMALVRTSIDTTNWTMEQAVDAIKATCEAYLKQGTNLQYDQYNSRRHFNANCDDANNYEYTFLDCSSFVNSVYYYLFGINTTTSDNVDTSYFIRYANTNKANNIVTLSADSSDIGDKTEARAAEIRAMLQPGDLYIYRHDNNSAGHVMLYVGTLSDGNDYFYHATGAAGESTSNTYSNGPYERTIENQTSYEKNYGTITLDKADIVFIQAQGKKGTSGTSDRYIFNSNNDHWAIIRPLIRMTRSSINGTLTSNAVNKLMYGSSMNIEKTATIQNHHSVETNTNNLYKLSIKNDSNKEIEYIYVEENIPANATYVECTSGGVYANNKIVWKIDKIAAKSTVNLSYTLKATGEIGAEINDNATYINGLKFNDISVNIKAKTTDKYSKISTITTGTILDAIKQFYSTNYSVDLVNDLDICNASKTYTVQALLDDMLPFTSTSYYYTDCRYTDTSFSNLVPSGMYGGTRYRTEYISDVNSIRNVQSTYLEPGDIIFVNYKTDYGVYYYASSTAIYGDNSSGVITKLYSTTSTVNGFLHTLPYYFRFMVIRPSMSSKLNNK